LVWRARPRCARIGRIGIDNPYEGYWLFALNWGA
jgi:hypothetical protein